MKKFLYLALCLVLVLTMAVCFVSCGEDKDTTKSTQGTTSPSTNPSTNPSSGSSSSTNPSSGSSSSSDSDSSSGSDTSSSSDSSSSTDSSTPDAGGDEHKHTYDTEYSYDDENHYYAANCEHTDEKLDVAPHEYDEYGNCVCGYYKVPTITSIEQALQIAASNNGKIIFGVISSSDHNKEYLSTTTSVTTFEIYEKYTHINTVDDYVTDYYFALDEYDMIFAVMIQGEFPPSIYEDALEENLTGAKIPFGFIGDYENFAYGAYDFVVKLYEMATASLADGEELQVTIEGTKLSFGYTTEDARTVSVEFVIGTEGAISSVKVTADSEMFSYECTIEQQTTIEEAKENPYAPEKVILDSYIIADKDGNDITETVINAKAGELVKFFFTEVEPTTAMLSLATIDITVVEASGRDVMVFPIPYYPENAYGINFYNPGTYTVTITVDGVETETTVEIALLDPNKISSQVYNPSYGVFEETSSANAFVGKELYFSSYVGEKYNGAYTAEILGDVAESVAFLSEGEVDGEAVTVFKAAQAGTYTVKLTSAVNAELSCELVIEVVEAPNVEEMLTGYYEGTNEYGVKIVTAKFIDNTVEVVLNGAYKEVISFEYVDGYINYDYVSGDEIVLDFYVSDSYELVMDVDGYSVVLTPAQEPVKVDPAAEGKKGTFVIVDVINNGKNSATYTYEIDEEGVFKFFKDGVETQDVRLTTDLGGNFTITWPGSYVVQTLIKTDNKDTFAGTYKTEMNLGGSIFKAAEITIIPISDETPGGGDTGDDDDKGGFPDDEF